MKDLGKENDADVDTILQAIKDKAAHTIMSNPKTDVALHDILVKHIVTSSPADDAVERAMDEIKRLVGGKVSP